MGGGMLGRRGERRRACWPDPHRTGHPDSLHLGGRRQTGACDSPSRGKGYFPIDVKATLRQA